MRLEHPKNEIALKRIVGWDEKAADRENIDAQYMLGVCFYNGTGKSQSLPIAQRWFAKANAKNHPTATLHLD